MKYILLRLMISAHVQALSSYGNLTTSTTTANYTGPGPQSATIPLQSTTDSGTTVSAASGLGSYIFQGLGLGSNQDAAVSSSSSISKLSSTLGPTSSSNAVPPPNMSAERNTVVTTTNLTSTSITSPPTASSAIGSTNHSSNSTGANSTVGPSGVCTNISCASSCNVLWQEWSSASSTYSVRQASLNPITRTTVSTSGSYVSQNTSFVYPSVAAYTLCDGFPRANATPTTIIENITEIGTITTKTITTVANYTISTPSCSINPVLCMQLANNSLTKGEPICDLPEGYDFMVTDSGVSLFQDEAYDYCNFEGGPVQLLYWPVSTAGGLCGHNGTTLANAGPSTVVYSGSTLTSPTVYLKFSTLFAVSYNIQYWNSSYTSHLGQGLQNFLVHQDPGTVSTICMRDAVVYDDPNDAGQDGLALSTTRINYADLNYPIKSSVYACGGQAPGNGTIWNNYAPMIGFPTNLGSLQPEWAACSFGQGYGDGEGGNFIFDPPHMLTAEPTLAVPAVTTTAVSKPSLTTAASPSTTPLAPTPPATSTRTLPSAQSTDAQIPSLQSSAAASHLSSATLQSTGPSAADNNGKSNDPETSTVISDPALDTSSPQQPSQTLDSTTKPLGESQTTSALSSSDNIASLIASVLGVSKSETASLVSAQAFGLSTAVAASGSDPLKPSPSVAGASQIGSKVDEQSSANLDPGGPVSASAGISSADPSATAVVVGSQTYGGQAQSADQASGAVVTLGSQVYTAVASDGSVIVDGQTLAEGESTVSIDNKPISVAGTAIYVDGSTVAFSALAATRNTIPSEPGVSAAVVTIGSAVHTALASNGIISIDGQTLSPGGSALTVSDTVVSAVSSGLVVDGSTAQFSQIPDTTGSGSGKAAIITIGSQTFTGAQSVASDGSTVIVLDSHSVTVGGSAATINGVSVSAASGGVVVGSSTIPYGSSLPSSGAAAVFTLGSETLTAYTQGNGDMIIESTTLAVGGPAATIHGEVVSQASQGLIVGGSTFTYSTATADPQLATFTVGSKTLTASKEANGDVVIGSTTLMAGGAAVTIDGEAVSQASGGLVVGSSTISYSTTSTANLAAVFTIGTQTLTASREADGVVEVGGKTVTEGAPAVTIDGEVVSVGASAVVIDGSKTVLFSTSSVPVTGTTSTARLTSPSALITGQSTSASTTSSGVSETGPGYLYWYWWAAGLMVMISMYS